MADMVASKPHCTRSFGPFELNHATLTATTDTYVTREGETRPADDKPAKGGLRFGFMQRADTNHVWVRIEDVVLSVPLQVEEHRHIGTHPDGRARGLGRVPTDVDDEHAKALLVDAIAVNREHVDTCVQLARFLLSCSAV